MVLYLYHTCYMVFRLPGTAWSAPLDILRVLLAGGDTGCMRWDIRRRGCDTWRPREPPEPPRYLTNVIKNQENPLHLLKINENHWKSMKIHDFH